MLVFSRSTSQKLITFLAKPSKDDLIILRDLVATGKVTPVIDRCYRLREVPEAIRYLEQGHARRKVVITLESNHPVVMRISQRFRADGRCRTRTLHPFWGTSGWAVTRPEHGQLGFLRLDWAMRDSAYNN